MLMAVAFDSSEERKLGGRDEHSGGMESGVALPYKGLVDDVRLYSRALNNAKIQTLPTDRNNDARIGNILSGINSVPGNFEDLSLQIPGEKSGSRTSAFAIDTIQEPPVYSLSKDALSYSGISSTSDLRHSQP